LLVPFGTITIEDSVPENLFEVIYVDRTFDVVIEFSAEDMFDTCDIIDYNNRRLKW
jgi:hypothetical protein